MMETNANGEVITRGDLKAEEAEYNEVTEDSERKDKNTLPALNYELPRHPLMKNGDTLPVLQEELELDKKLGLQKQAQHTGSEALKLDIDELTSSHDYHEISKKQLNKLFKINELNRICSWINFKSSISAWWNEIKNQSNPAWVIGTIVCVAVFCSTVYALAPTTPDTGWNIFSGVMCILVGIIGSIICIIGYCIALFEDFTIRYTLIEAKLHMESVKTTDIKLPYGVKLKMLEAQETGIFEAFTIANPRTVETEYSKEYSIKLSSIDPAVLGVTADSRMYMIAYWDIENDIDKTKESIDKFERFKVK